MTISSGFSPEVRERAVRMFLEHQGEHASQWATMESVVARMTCTSQTLRKWVQQAERNQGVRPGLSGGERERINELEWVDRFNSRSLLEATGCFPPVEFDDGWY